MTNYIEEIKTVDRFAAEASPKLKEKALAAKDYLKGRYENVNDKDFVVIEVEGYHCIALIKTKAKPCILDDIIAPFDEQSLYPLQELVTQYAFKIYR